MMNRFAEMTERKELSEVTSRELLVESIQKRERKELSEVTPRELLVESIQKRKEERDQKEEKESLSEERRRRLRKRFGIMDRRTFELDSDQMR